MSYDPGSICTYSSRENTNGNLLSVALRSKFRSKPLSRIVTSSWWNLLRRLFSYMMEIMKKNVLWFVDFLWYDSNYDLMLALQYNSPAGLKSECNDFSRLRYQRSLCCIHWWGQARRITGMFCSTVQFGRYSCTNRCLHWYILVPGTGYSTVFAKMYVLFEILLLLWCLKRTLHAHVASFMTSYIRNQANFFL
jgi:hypothetical protein